MLINRVMIIKFIYYFNFNIKNDLITFNNKQRSYMLKQPINPLQNLLRKNAQNTPTRQRQLITNQPTEYHSKQREDNRSSSPNKLNATKKPIISMNKNGFHRTVQKLNMQPDYQACGQKYYSTANKCLPVCSNHPNKNADFFVTFQNQDLNYCEKCAINLASKGFSINKREQKIEHHNFISKPKHKFNFPQFSSAVGYSQIKQLVDHIDKIFDKFADKLLMCHNIQSHYNQQYRVTDQYYSGLLEVVQLMRQDHLNDLLLEKQNHSQLALIKIGDISEDMKTIDTIRNDLTSSIVEILDNYHEQSTQKNLNYYRQQILMNFQDKISEHQTFSDEIINYKQQILKNRLKNVEEYLLDIWNDDEQGKPKNQNKKMDKIPESRPLNFKFSNNKTEYSHHSHNTNHNHNHNRQNTACRKLFQDSIELAGQTSPQFKNI